MVHCYSITIGNTLEIKEIIETKQSALGSLKIKQLDENLTAFFFVIDGGFTMKVKPRVKPKLS